MSKKKTVDDLFADSAPVATTTAEAKEIGIIVARALALKNEIDAMQAQLTERTREYTQLVERDLPEAMDAANCGEFKDATSGKKITVKDDVHASISKDNAPAAHDWLRTHEHGDIIKNEIVIPLTKGMDNVANAIIREVKANWDVEIERKESVHASTLKAFCREQLAKGVDLPAGLLGLYIRRVAVIK